MAPSHSKADAVAIITDMSKMADELADQHSGLARDAHELRPKTTEERAQEEAEKQVKGAAQSLTKASDAMGRALFQCKQH